MALTVTENSATHQVACLPVMCSELTALARKIELARGFTHTHNSAVEDSIPRSTKHEAGGEFSYDMQIGYLLALLLDQEKSNDHSTK
ncbi:hypothetical protein NC652_009736 [Populus alba x Populus x berolinensis]|nr:hypothetical protein NC652_009736 [Populus alba x Populus x berolinensis]